MNGMHGPPQPWPPNADGMMPTGYFPPRGPPQAGPSAQSSQASPIPGYQPNPAFPLGGPRGYGPAGQRSGAPTPSNMGANFAPGQGPGGGPPPGMFPNEQQMRGMAAVQQQSRMPPNQIRMPPAAMRGIRPGGFPPGQQPGNYFDDPSGTPPFPHVSLLL